MPDSNSSSFSAALTKLGASLNSSSSTTIKKSCLLTLLRIIDNILKDDPSSPNLKLRKIKVTNVTFWKRTGQYSGSIDFLLACGFTAVGGSSTTTTTTTKASSIPISGATKVGEGGVSPPSQLKLEKDDVDRLLVGRGELVKFAVECLKMEEGSLPSCPKGTGGGGASNEKKPAAAATNVASAKKASSPDVAKRNKVGGVEVTKKMSGDHADKKKKPAPSSAASQKKKAMLPPAASASATANGDNAAQADLIEEKKDDTSASTALPKQPTLIQQQPKKRSTVVAPSPPLQSTKPKSFSLEEIQQLAQKEREEGQVEKQKLQKERTSRSEQQKSSNQRGNSDRERGIIPTATATTSTAAPQKKKKKQQQQQQQKQQQKKQQSSSKPNTTTIPIRRQDSITSTTSPTSDEHLRELQKRRRKELERQTTLEMEQRKRDKELEELNQKLVGSRQQQQLLNNGVGGTTTSAPSSNGNKEGLASTRTTTTIKEADMTISASDGNDLEDEMTCLLDEIENELNDDFFNDTNTNDETDDISSSPPPAHSLPAAVADKTNEWKDVVASASSAVSEEQDAEIIEDVREEGGVEKEELPSLPPSVENHRVHLEQTHHSIGPSKKVNAEKDIRTVARLDSVNKKIDQVMTNDYNVASSDIEQNNPKANDDEPPLHLSKAVEELVESKSISISDHSIAISDDNSSGGDDNVGGNKKNDQGGTASSHKVADESSFMANKSASDLLGDLESEAELMRDCVMRESVPLVSLHEEKMVIETRGRGGDGDINHTQQQIAMAEEQNDNARKEGVKGEASNVASTEALNDIFENASSSDSSDHDHESPQSLSSADGNAYSNMFTNIPLPEGEDNEDGNKFRLGFELCHTALLSIWLPSSADNASVIPGANQLMKPHSSASTCMAGLSNLQRRKQIWEERNENREEENPVVLVPLAFVYTIWSYILGLDTAANDENEAYDHQRNNQNSIGVQSGMIYKWVVSNHEQLGVFDQFAVGESLFNNDRHGLPESSIGVCNYVCKALRDIGLVSIYEADVDEISEVGGRMRSTTVLPDENLFVGISNHAFEECVQKNSGVAFNALDGKLLHRCHGILGSTVYPSVSDMLCISNSNNKDPSSEGEIDQVSIWYFTQHAVRHLITSGQVDIAKILLLDSKFVRLRLQIMGLLSGASAHCRECAKLNDCLLQLLDEWRRRQLQVDDGRRQHQLSASFSSVDGGFDLDSLTMSGTAPDIARWKEDHFKILCSISAVLRDKGEKTIASSAKDVIRLRQLQHDIGDAHQMIGKCMGEIGVYRAEEMGHYEEALRLKSEAFEDDQNHESIADILYIMGCHHQRYQHYKFAQKCYEQSLRIYKITLGYEHLCVARVLHNIGIMYHAKKDNTVALKCLKKSLSIRNSQHGDKDLCVADSYCWIGNIYREKRKLTDAREYFLKAHRIKVNILGKAHIESAEVLHNVGIVCDDLGLNSQSLSCFREALLIRLANVKGAYDISGINDVCETLDCIANVYRIKGENQKALQFFEQCLKRRVRIVSSAALSEKAQVSLLLRTYDDVISLTKLQLKSELVDVTSKNQLSEKIGTLLVEMGVIYDQRLKKDSKALVYLQKALQVFQQKKDYQQIGRTLSLIGVIHVRKSDNQKAIKCFKDSLVMRKMSNPKKETAGVADTLHNIGNCEAREGKFEESLRSYREALRIKENMFPNEQHLSIAKTQHCMGLAMLQLGELDDALDSFELALKARRKLLGSNHLDVSFSLHSLGRIYFHQNQVDSAVKCLEEALEIKQFKLSEKHMSLAETQHLLSSLYIRTEMFEPAIPLLKNALVAYRNSRGDCEIIKSDVLDLLGSAYAQLGDDGHAVLSYEHSLKIKKVVVGKDHVACANVQMEIGKLKSRMDDIDGALVAFKDVKRIQKILFGKNHLKNADLLIQVGLIQDRLNNNDMALRCFAEALRMRRKLLDKKHGEIAEALVHTGRMHQQNNEHTKSLHFFREAIEIYRESESDNTSQEYANACHLLGLSQMASGDSDNALQLLESSLQLRESIYGSDSEQWAEVAYDLSVAKCEAGLYDDAIVLLDQYILLQKGLDSGSDNVRLSNATLQLGKIYLKRRDTDNAMAYFDEALALRKKMGDNELGVAEVLFQIGGVRESKKQYLESLVCYEESLRLRLSISGEDEETADVVSRIGEVRRVRGQFDLAMENFTLALDMYKRTVGEAHLSVASTYHSLGYVCDAKGDVQKAMQNHKEGLSVRKLILGGDHVKIAASLDDVAGMYQKQNDHEKALRCLKEALRIRKLRLGNSDIEISKTLFGMGIIFAAIDDNEKATECYHASLEISERDGSNPKLEAQTLHQIGCLNANNCNYKEALQNWRTCLSKYRESGMRDDHYMVACTLGNIEMAQNVVNSS